MIDMQGAMEVALGNGGRPYLYKLRINFPGEVSFMGMSSIDTLCKATVIPGVKVSQRAFHDVGGRVFNLPGMKIYDTEWTGTFYLDENYAIRGMLEKWIAGIDYYNGQYKDEIEVNKGIVAGAVDSIASYLSKAIGAPDTGTDIGFTAGNKVVGDFTQGLKDYLSGKKRVDSTNEKNYYSTIEITQTSITGGDIMTYELQNAYPIMLSPIQFDDTRIDAIGEFTCSFSFSSYTIKTPKSLLNKIRDVTGL